MTGPSITRWNRLEPRPRAPRIAETLAAAVRDPLWMLARQWQFGEFHGEDAGSPATVELAARLTRIEGWRSPGAARVPLTGGRPIEAVVLGEPFTADLATRIELGHTFAALLADRLTPDPVPPALRAALAAAFPVPDRPAARPVTELFAIPWDAAAADPVAGGLAAPALQAALAGAGTPVDPDSLIRAAAPGGPWLLTDAVTAEHYLLTAVPAAGGAPAGLRVHRAAVPDRDAAAFTAVCAGRALDGAALLAADPAALPGPLAAPGLAAVLPAVRAALDDLRAWSQQVLGAVGSADSASWAADRLQYEVGLDAGLPGGGHVELVAVPDRDAGLDWAAFDVRAVTAPGAQPAGSTGLALSVLPANVRFRGMPNARWWDFEPAGTDFGAIVPDGPDLAKLVVMDFMLVHGNDWFLLPVPQPVGSLCTVQALLVHDVFGQSFLVERADAVPTGAPPPDWTMFSTSAPGGPAGFFLLPPGAGGAAMPSAAVEQVRFARDEGANLVWAVEQSTENGVGRPWAGREREQAVRQAAPDQPPPAAVDGAPPLAYRLASTVPEHWIPYLPASVDIARGTVALQRAAVPSAEGGLTGPAGRVLAGTPQVREESLPRNGISVERTVLRSRWTDGSTVLWIARRVLPGTGDASSGLVFDEARPTVAARVSAPPDRPGAAPP